MQPHHHAVIMAGGSGTRFWPASRLDRPKQLLPLAGDGRTLIEATVERMAAVVPRANIWIITNPRQVAGIQTALPGFDRDRIIVEPEPRDTAAAVALSLASLEARAPGATMAVVPSDHLIEPIDRFAALMRCAFEVAEDDKTLTTFGIRPTYPATGFGYIEPGDPHPCDGADAWSIARFREKPDLETAREFLASGKQLWNSGMFVWTNKALMSAIETSNPELARATREMIGACEREDAAARDAAFRSAPKISFDYAVMERAEHAAVIATDFDWSDLGSFLALDSIAAPDGDGNVEALFEGARAALHDAKDCTVYGEGPRTVAMLGTQGLVCVAVDDAVLVCPKDRVDDMKALVQQLRERGQDELL